MSIVIYPFSVKMAVPPLAIPNSEKDLLTFHFETVPLFCMDAEPYVQNHQTCMYPILPAMRGFHADMLVDFVRVKYPDLVDLAQEQASHFDDPKVSRSLIHQVTVAANVDRVRQLLEQKTL